MKENTLGTLLGGIAGYVLAQGSAELRSEQHHARWQELAVVHQPVAARLAALVCMLVMVRLAAAVLQSVMVRLAAVVTSRCRGQLRTLAFEAA